MLKYSEETIDSLEQQYPGIKKTIISFESANLPPCPHCTSSDTASVQVGIIGRTINLAAVTTKVALIANGPKEGKFLCNPRRTYFD